MIIFGLRKLPGIAGGGDVPLRSRLEPGGNHLDKQWLVLTSDTRFGPNGMGFRGIAER